MKKRILIIDDDARNIFALSATLKSRGYETESSDSALKSIDMLKLDARFDAILIDMMMPEMDGYEAIPLMRDILAGHDTPIIAVTAQAMMGDREKCLLAGADNYLSKPIDVDRLFAMLSTTTHD